MIVIIVEMKINKNQNVKDRNSSFNKTQYDSIIEVGHWDLRSILLRSTVSLLIY